MQEQATSPISNEKGTTNLVQINSSNQTDTNDAGTDEGNYSDAQTRTSRQASPKITREQDKLQGLLQELSTPTKGETDEDDVEGSEDSISQSLARLYQKASLAEKRVTKANQDEILCWYHYAEGFEKKVKDITDNNKKVKDQQARTQVYNFIIPHLPGVTKENLRKKTQKARNIYKLFKKIGVKRIKRVVSFSADTISKLTANQIQSIIDRFTNSTVDHVI
ncbi:hypothetical protein Glove_278g41 [Diversispora epigaea]|uniref:Uncharacterized protein n=1 Tax=Diversispora epigaea TaxID=1348612 RepID=A0A397I3N1_9GLOM|nr:hypothetical protein Glove_278g41 [Diversispora epigaea]